MCELFGFSSNRPIAAREMPLSTFGQRGGQVANNPDGWGIAWREMGQYEMGQREVGQYEVGHFRLAKEPFPACSSEQFARLCDSLATDLLVAHVRKAKFPPVNTMNNTHPFLRDCCGRRWAFAHNGLVPEIVDMEATNRGRICRPEGETDSEFAFCHLLSHVSQNFHSADWLAALGRVSELIALRGQFNFLMSDGEHLIAYGHDRLHYQETAGGSGYAAMVATEPLSAPGAWTPFVPGELRIYRAGALLERILTRPETGAATA
jgi:predicted glutamine amidotransferase